MTRKQLYDKVMAGVPPHGTVIEHAGGYFGWTRTWEGPRRPDWSAAATRARMLNAI